MKGGTMGQQHVDTEAYRIKPKQTVKLDKMDPADDGGWDKDEAVKQFHEDRKEIGRWQELLYAEGKRSLLVVFQAMDAGGKDSTIRQVFARTSPSSCRVTSFKAPEPSELKHDFLWRVHQHTPADGMIGVFNRSHYEDVLIVRVKKLVPEKVWRKRYEHINDFEKLLTEEGTAIVKFFLHISKDYQRQRLERRLERPDKHWKLSLPDLAERKRWHEYQQAFEHALERCSTDYAPWYVIPAQTRWYRNLLVARVVRQTLEAMGPRLPEPTFDIKSVTIPK